MAAVPADLVVSATPFSLENLIKVGKPIVRVGYEMGETGEPSLSEFVRAFLWRQGLIG